MSIRMYLGLVDFDSVTFNSYCLFVKSRSHNSIIAFCCITFFKDPVEATGKGQNYFLKKGSSVRFKCPVAGNPEPNISWYNGSTVPISFEKELESRESGCYTCIADNSLGKSINITQCLTIITGKLFRGLFFLNYSTAYEAVLP